MLQFVDLRRATCALFQLLVAPLSRRYYRQPTQPPTLNGTGNHILPVRVPSGKSGVRLVGTTVHFSKAFDTVRVRHSTLLEKISLLDIPDHVYNWIVDFSESTHIAQPTEVRCQPKRQ